ncbi:MAG: cytochrome c [Rhodocyclales bacterium]|nr:cytochrome c [Rhodocyclales bacterium]
MALVLAASGTATAQAPAPPPETSSSVTTVVPSADLGRRAYTTYCTRCHGINLVVGSSAFFDLRTFPPEDKDRFLSSVSKGLRAMPAWGGIVKQHEMESIWLYIGSVNGWEGSAGR